MRTCATCGRVTVDPNAMVCVYCGAALPPVLPAEAPPSAPQTPQTPGYPPAYGAPAGPSQPMYPPNYGAPGVPSQSMYPGGPAAPSQPMYPPSYGAPGAPSQSMYPGAGYPQAPASGAPQYVPGGYPQAPAPGTQPFYPGAYPPGSPYAQAPGATWRPAEQKPRPTGLIIGSVVALIVVVVVGLAVGIGLLAKKQVPTTPSAKATATAQSNIIYNDSMTDSPSGWLSNGNCFGSTDGYHVSDGYVCYAPVGDLSDGSVTVSVKETSGVTDYPYGIDFDISSDQSHYGFDVTASGDWALIRYDGVAGTNDRLQDYSSSSAIRGGFNNTNTLKVDFRGGTFTLSINGEPVGTVNDPSPLGPGKVGLIAGQGVNAVFTNLVITK